MTTPVRHWRYDVPGAPGIDRATVFLDSTGVFTSVSAYGAFGHWYDGPGTRDFREFIMQLGEDPYHGSLFDKLTGAHREKWFTGNAKAFVEKVMPRLAAILRAELTAEGYFDIAKEVSP